MSDNDKLMEHRKQQLSNLMQLIESVQEEVRTAISHNTLLNKRKD